MAHCCPEDTLNWPIIGYLKQGLNIKAHLVFSERGPGAFLLPDKTALWSVFSVTT